MLPHSILPPTLALPPATSPVSSISVVLLFSEYYISGIISVELYEMEKNFNTA